MIDIRSRNKKIEDYSKFRKVLDTLDLRQLYSVVKEIGSNEEFSSFELDSILKSISTFDFTVVNSIPLKYGIRQQALMLHYYEELNKNEYETKLGMI